MKRTVLLFLLWVASSALATTQEQRFPLLGLWRVAVASTGDGKRPASNEQMEMEFLPDGVLVVTAVSPAKGMSSPVRLRFRYTFQPPDVVTYTFTGDPVERQRFKVSGDTATFDHLDYKVHSELRRIQKTEFTEPPKDIHDFPK